MDTYLFSNTYLSPLAETLGEDVRQTLLNIFTSYIKRNIGNLRTFQHIYLTFAASNKVGYLVSFISALS